MSHRSHEMFIKCLTIVSYIISLLFLVYFSFQYSLESWGESDNLNFVLIMMAIFLMIILIVIAAMNLSSTIKVWREMEKQKSDFDQIIE